MKITIEIADEKVTLELLDDSKNYDVIEKLAKVFDMFFYEGCFYETLRKEFKQELKID